MNFCPCGPSESGVGPNLSEGRFTTGNTKRLPGVNPGRAPLNFSAPEKAGRCWLSSYSVSKPAQVQSSLTMDGHLPRRSFAFS